MKRKKPTVKGVRNITEVNEFLNPEEVADIPRVNVLTVYGYIQKDNLDAVRLGRNYRIIRPDLGPFFDPKELNPNSRK